MVLLGVNCKKSVTNNSSDKYHTLKGRLMVNCTTPYANKSIQLKGDNSFTPEFSVGKNGEDKWYTDENGYFEIIYKPNGSAGTLFAPIAVMKFIPISNKVLDIGEVNLGGTFNFVIKLQANNPYTENDTLILRDFNGASAFSELRVPGPFQSGLIDTVLNEGYSSYPINYASPIKFDFAFYLSSNLPGLSWATLNALFCSSTFSEAIITID